jgi:hypothetical protein
MTTPSVLRAKAAQLYAQAAALDDLLERLRCVFDAIELEYRADEIERGSGPAAAIAKKTQTPKGT